MEQIKDLLKTLPLFQNFSPWELLKLIEKSLVKTFEPGDCIIGFGEPGKFLGIVINGEAEVSSITETGEKKRLTILQKGDMFGEMSLLTGEPTCADVSAFNKCDVFLLPQETFSSSLIVNPAAMKIMAKTLSERLRNRQDDEEAQQRLKDAWHYSSDPYGFKLSPSLPAKILVINCGSSSLKYNYYDTAQENNNLEGLVERIGLDNSRNIIKRKSGKTTIELGSVDYAKAFQAVIAVLTDPSEGVIKDLKEITAVGHRVVHGSDKYNNPVIINEEVIKDIHSFSSLAPLHNPPNLMAIKESVRLM